MNHSLRTLLIVVGLLTGTADITDAQQRAGSIYNPDQGPFILVGNKTARRIGDLVTIVISENQDLKNEERSDLAKGSSLDYALSSFNVKPNAFGILPGIESAGTDTFTGTANYEKKGTFTARLTAVVIDSLPNGNLVVSGRREIHIDKEVKVLEFSGVLRRYDIAADNTVESELVANAVVRYAGSGPLTRSTNRVGLGGWLHDAITWLWPF
jgi:flagellar L-ring protein precursor FlgH